METDMERIVSLINIAYLNMLSLKYHISSSLYHVLGAGTIAGKTYGVAKAAQVIAVKVFTSDGYATTTGILKALEYVAQQHMNGTAGSVASMSLGGGRDRPLDEAVNAVTRLGVHVSG